ncbi:50S ribosomal protein L29 [Patescibacteria group bacterium]|nr:MAG: 50S ribosomal protein L29 [Patescibacteria group bacterium]
MEFKELSAKTSEELERLAALRREELRALRFRVSVAEEKKIRTLRELKKMIARILTARNQKSTHSTPLAKASSKLRVDTEPRLKEHGLARVEVSKIA